MKNSLFLFVGAAALSLASCSQDKPADTTTTTDATTTTTSTDATASTDADAQYQSRAQRIADKFAADMKIADEATKTKIRTAYYNRSKRLGELRNKYTSDTAGMAAAMRAANTETDTEFKGILTDPTQYQSYESSRSTYDESNYTDNSSSMSSSADMNSSTDNSSAAMSDASGDGTTVIAGGAVKQSKTKMQDDSKIKVEADGTVKTKEGDGSGDPTALDKSKTKMMDGSKIKIKSDGTIKTKDAEGNKTKM